MKRVEWSKDHKDCVDAMNACIASAQEHGFSAICPERGIVYFAMKGGDGLEEIFSNMSHEFPVISHLNMDKTDRNWAPFRPFVNSIRDLDSLYDFVRGELSIFVCVDAAYLCERLVMPGWKVSFLDHGDYSFLFVDSDSGANMAISRQFFSRLIYEFMSADWFAEHEKLNIAKVVENAPAAALAGAPLVPMDEMIAMFQAIPKLIERS